MYNAKSVKISHVGQYKTMTIALRQYDNGPRDQPAHFSSVKTGLPVYYSKINITTVSVKFCFIILLAKFVFKIK